ncbi:MAG: hydroxypyruvate isomerase [Hyphomicrobiales bacterium]|nr:MAG: hydroxypyruvate isomerase [Hyphomicrobiales bacterium]
MPRFAANLSMMFTERPFMERFAAAAEAGFEAVEYLFPYEHDAAAIRAELDSNGLTQALFNLPPGNWDEGERGLAALPGREGQFAASLDTALAYAEVIGVPRLHAMAGIASGEDARAAYIANLKLAAEKAAERGLTLLIEPINTRDMPGYHLSRTDDALAVIDAVGAANLRLQLDLYHCQIMEGDLARHIERLLPFVDHIQIAGVPDRHEPDLGEVNYPYLFDRLDELGYDGWIGCEYRPRDRTENGLGWFGSYRAR